MEEAPVFQGSRCAFALAIVCLAAGACGDRAPEPVAATQHEGVRETRHGVEIPDRYRWLEDDEDPDVVAWDRAEAARTARYLEEVEDREALRQRVEAELRLGGAPSLPRFRGNRRFYDHRRVGQAHAVLYVQDAEAREESRVVLDPNRWSEDRTASLEDTFPSPDGSLVAYLRSSHGSEAASIHVRDVARGVDLPDVISRAKFASLAWEPDGRGFLYTRLPAPDDVPSGEGQYHRRVYRHRLGDLPADDLLVAGRGRPAIEWPSVWRSADGVHVFLGREREDESEDVFEVTWTKKGAPEVRPLLVGHDCRVEIDRHGDTFVLCTDLDAPRRAVHLARPETVGDPDRWSPLLPEGPGVIQGIRVVGERVVAHVREDLVSRLRVFRLDGAEDGEIDLPPDGSVGWMTSRSTADDLYFTFESAAQPSTQYRCDLGARKRSLVKLSAEPTTAAVERLVAQRFDYRSRDGTSIPLFVLRRRDVPLDGTAPTVLYGYGGFRVSMHPRFSRSAALWAELGGVQAVACIRGGHERGETWHEQGARENKQNVFDDFIAAADWLVETGRSSRDRLAILGGSNGGLLVAACVNQRPDLCRAVLCLVPLTDMLRFHRFQYARAWTPEYGDPDEPEAFRWLHAYSPYHNVTDGAPYPAMYVTAGLHDGRVDAFHARKIVARWQEATSSGRPVLLDIDRASGHGAASSWHRERAMLHRLCFLRRELGRGAASRVKPEDER